MKILDRYILTSYLKTFISVFLILMLIFVLQTIWLYIRELAGKDLDIIVIFKFLIYFMPKLIPLVVPLTILLASIMVFGDFAENYEFAAMKSTGISLMRAMSGLSIFIVILSITTFFFSNNVIPWAEYNSYNLRKNIAKLKPAMLLAKGQFNEVGETGYNIKFSNKTGDNEQYLQNIIIHIKGNNRRTNATTIKAKYGELITSETSNILKLVLFDGNYYSDMQPKSSKARKKVPFAKSEFDKYIINIDISYINNEGNLDEKSITNKYSMLNISDLNYTLDSLSQQYEKEHKDFSERLYNRTITPSLKQKLKKPLLKDVVTTKSDSMYYGNILDLFETKNKSQVLKIATNSIKSSNLDIAQRENSFKISKSNFNKHIISLHEKFALGFACIILFFVGAPLGALIRKGGIGLPMVIAILLFLTYHFIGIFATNSAKSGGLNPVIATWFSTLTMLPLGVFLTKRATEDKGLFGFGNFVEPIKKLFGIKDKETIDYKFLLSFTNNKLFEVIKNYKELGHTSEIKYEAIKILSLRGLNLEDIQKETIEIKEDYVNSYKKHTNFTKYSKYSIILYCFGTILTVLFFVFKNNNLPNLASSSIQIGSISLFIYMIFYVKSYLNMSAFYKAIHKPQRKPNIGLFMLGLPVYFLTYFLLKRKIEDNLKQNCIDSIK